MARAAALFATVLLACAAGSAASAMDPTLALMQRRIVTQAAAGTGWDAQVDAALHYLSTNNRFLDI